MVLYKVFVFDADRKSNMIARAHNVFWLVEILKILLKTNKHGGHFEPRSGSLNTILEVDHPRTIDDMFAILAY
jgi:hypothetical protein